jgi:glycosyltransferase involved in cell wall biosynthesis
MNTGACPKMVWEERAQERLARLEAGDSIEIGRKGGEVSTSPQRLAGPESDSCRSRSSVTAFFPAYNDAATIAGLVAYTDRVLSRVAVDYEIIVVNDASEDDTAAVLEAITSRYPRLKVVTHVRNRGYGGALRAGFAHAAKDLIFYTDGDGQYDPTEILSLLPHIDGADLVNGYKIRRADAMYRVVIGRLYHWTAKLLFGLKVRDVDCDFRLVRRSLIEQVNLVSMKGSICCEMIKKLQMVGCRIVEVPVHHYPRVSGRSQFFKFSKVVLSLAMLLRLWSDIVLAPTLQPLRRWLPRRGVQVDHRPE